MDSTHIFFLSGFSRHCKTVPAMVSRNWFKLTTLGIQTHRKSGNSSLGTNIRETPISLPKKLGYPHENRFRH